MTDYAKHIEVLADIACEQDTKPELAALTAAIELMRAATPKSPEEEREHARRRARDFQTCAFGTAVEMWEADRAVARAEGYARGQEAVLAELKQCADLADVINLEQRMSR